MQIPNYCANLYKIIIRDIRQWKKVQQCIDIILEPKDAQDVLIKRREELESWTNEAVTFFTEINSYFYRLYFCFSKCIAD